MKQTYKETETPPSPPPPTLIKNVKASFPKNPLKNTIKRVQHPKYPTKTQDPQKKIFFFSYPPSTPLPKTRHRTKKHSLPPFPHTNFTQQNIYSSSPRNAEQNDTLLINTQK